MQELHCCDINASSNFTDTKVHSIFYMTYEPIQTMIVINCLLCLIHYNSLPAALVVISKNIFAAVKLLFSLRDVAGMM